MMTAASDDALGLTGQEDMQTAPSVAPPLVINRVLELAAKGLPVFPCGPDKAPLVAGGFHAATTDPEQIRQWWAMWPHALPGMPTGARSGIDVLDIDVAPARGINGFETLKANGWQIPPDARLHRTRQGGAHWIMKADGVRNSAGTLGPGLDVRGEGGYVILWPAMGLPVQEGTIYPAPEWLGHRQQKAPPAASNPQSPIPEGMRNTALTSIAGTLRAHGLNADHVADVLARINEDRCDPPLDEGEIAQIAASVGRYAPAPQPWDVFAHPAPLPAGAIVPAAYEGTDLALDDGAPLSFNPWVLCLVPEGEPTLFAGHGGTGKSVLALLLALCIATGRPFLGLATRRGRVLFYSAEDPAKPLRIRLRALCERYGIDSAELRGRLTVTDMTEGDPVLYRGTGATEAFVRLRERIERERFDVVILDNASDVFDGNENERPRVRHFVRLCRQLVAAREGAVILLTHVDKSTARGFGGGQGYSGSTAWHNSCRSRLFLVRGEDETITLEHHKANYGPLASPIRLRWDGRVPVPLASDPTAAADVALWQIVALVHEFYGRGENVPTATSGPRTAYHLFASAAGFPRGMKAVQLFEVLRDAERQQLIRREFYRNADRKDRERWRPVNSGSAPVAPVAN